MDSAPGRRALWLGGILLFAFAIQLWGIGRDLPYASNVDEPFFVEPAVRIASSGSLNPGWFGHPGSLLIYPLAGVYHVRGALAEGGHWLHANPRLREDFAADPAAFYSLARGLSVGFATASLLFVYLLVRRVFDAKTGLAATFLVATTPLLAELAKLARNDGPSLFFVALALHLLFRALEVPSTRRQLAAGAGLGLAIADKYYLAVFAWLLGFIAVRQLWRARSAAPHAWRAELGRSSLAFALVPVTFALATPYFFLDLPTALVNLREEAINDLHPVSSLAATLAWYFGTAIPAVFGWLGTALLVIGAGWALRSREPRRLLFTSALVVFMVSISVLEQTWLRWLLPILPLGAALIAHAILATSSAVAERLSLPRARTALGVALVGLASLPSLYEAMVANRRFGIPSSGVEARGWLFDHAPSDARIGYEIDGNAWMKSLDDSFANLVARRGATRLRVDVFLSLAAGGHTLERYACEGYTYLVVNQNRANSFAATPRAAFYEQLARDGALRVTFAGPERPGPQLRIFEISGVPCSTR